MVLTKEEWTFGKSAVLLELRIVVEAECNKSPPKGLLPA